MTIFTLHRMNAFHHTRLLAASASALTLCLAGSTFCDDGANGHAKQTPSRAAKPVQPPLSTQLGVDFIPVPVVTLGPVDVFELLMEDEQTPQPAPMRFAVPRAVDVTVDDGEWTPVSGGHLWRLSIAAEEATCNRLHLTGLNMGEGQEMYLVTETKAREWVGPITDDGQFDTGEVWGLFAPATTSTIEWFVPGDAKPTTLPFEVVEISHGYIDVFSEVDPGQQDGGDGGVAGNCHNQPVCYSAWANESNATVRLYFSGGYLCSAQMMATLTADETPYVSTANHCISTQSEANSCQYRFFYRANTCGGSAAAGTTVTGGDLTDTYATSDCSLLMIRAEIPATTYWVGWLTTNPSNGTASTCLHHPSGDPQAISFGSKLATNNYCGSGNYWSQISWTSGVTEGGSSGSSIYRDSDHKLYGVLTCGGSYCATPQYDDAYGRWDSAYATSGGNFAAFLNAGTDDAQEDNDTCATAKAVSAGTLSALVCKSTDEDWYSFTVAGGTQATVTTTFTDANGDIDTELYASCGGSLLASATGSANTETLTWTNSGASQTVFLRVYLYTDTRNDYSMTISATAAGPANDECAGALAMSLGANNIDTTTASNSALALAASCIDGGNTTMYKDLWYRVTCPFNGTFTVSNCGNSTFDSRLAVYGSTCPTTATQVIACDDDTTGCASGTTSVSWPATTGQQFLVRVGGKNTAASGYTTVSFSGVPDAPPCPADLNGSGVVDGADLGILLSGWGTAGGDVNGDGATDGVDLGTMLADWGVCN